MKISCCLRKVLMRLKVNFFKRLMKIITQVGSVVVTSWRIFSARTACWLVMMKKYGVKYPHQANKCFLLLLPDEHECEMGGQQPSTQTISRNHYACRDVRFFLEIIFKFLSYGRCWESSSVFWWLFCCFVGLGVLRFYCIRAKSSLDSSAGHRTKNPKSFTTE